MYKKFRGKSSLERYGSKLKIHELQECLINVGEHFVFLVAKRPSRGEGQWELMYRRNQATMQVCENIQCTWNVEVYR